MARLALACALLGSGTAAYAADAITIPEPTDLVLFSMGVIGLILGRTIARKRPRD